MRFIGSINIQHQPTPSNVRPFHGKSLIGLAVLQHWLEHDINIDSVLPSKAADDLRHGLHGFLRKGVLVVTMLGADTPAAPHSSDHRQRQLPKRDGRHAAHVPQSQVPSRSAPSAGTRLANYSLHPSSSCASACVRLKPWCWFQAIRNSALLLLPACVHVKEES